MRKKLKIILLIVLIVSLIFLTIPFAVCAQEIENVDDILGQIDLSSLEKIFESLTMEEQEFLGSSLKDFLDRIINGNTFEIKELLGFFLSFFISLFADTLPAFIVILIVLFASGILHNIKPDFAIKSISNILSFASSIIIGSILCYSVFQVIIEFANLINKIYNLVQTIFPIIFSILVTMGASTTAGIMQTGIAIFLSILTIIINVFIIPICLGGCLLSIVTNLTLSFRLNKIPIIMQTVGKKVLLGVFVVFFTIISLQGISTQAYDSVGIRIAKFSLSKYIPLLGGYLSTGFDYLYSGSVIIKNTLGVAFLILLLVIILPIILKLLFIKIFAQILSSVALFIEHKNTSQMLNGVANSVSLMITSVVGIALSLGFFSVMIILSFNSLI